jgi:hypothetical protein
MHIRRSRLAQSTTRKLTELSVAAPQVVARRMVQMALSGPTPSARDRREFSGMVLEKQAAFTSSWQAMYVEALRLQAGLAAAFMQACSPFSRGSSASRTTSLSRELTHAALSVAEKGLTPVHAKAVSNAKRLARKRVR